MEEKIEQIFDIIKDYRESDLFLMTKDRIQNWVNQFDEDDREFILDELLHILPDSYISKEKALKGLGVVFEKLRTDLKYSSVEELLEHTCFLECQEAHKSQPEMLGFLDKHLTEKYGRSVSDCGSKEVRYWIYLDDVLASGGTCRTELLKVINEYGLEEFDNDGLTILCIFFFLHNWGYKNSTYAIDNKTRKNLSEEKIEFYSFGTIDNNPRLHDYYNPSPKFNHVYPKECDKGKEFLDFIEQAFERQHPMRNEEFAFRPNGHPKKEEFYSNPENRDRYETILLNKGIEIINNIDNLRAPGIRPLGMTTPSHKTLGTGSHFFTWRNISNTSPLVFWWEANGWTPLFPVKNRG